MGLTTTTTTDENEGKEQDEVNTVEPPSVEMDSNSPPTTARTSEEGEGKGEGTTTPPGPSPSLDIELDEGASSTHQLGESWIQTSSSASSLRRHEAPSSARSSFDGMEMEGNWVAGLEWNGTEEEETRGRKGGDGTLATSSTSSSSPLNSSFLSTNGNSPLFNNDSTSSSITSTRSRSSSHSHTQQPVDNEPSSSLLFPSPSQSFAHLPPLPSSPSLSSPTSPPPPSYYSSSTTTAAAAPVEWGLFEGGGKAEELEVHKDEGQIRLDTRRGFVVWPEGEIARICFCARSRRPGRKRGKERERGERET